MDMENMGIERQLLNEIIKREKELRKLKDAYNVLTGSEIIGVEEIQVEVPTVSKLPKKTVRGTPEHKKKLSEAMTKSWARRKGKVKVEPVPYKPKYKTQEQLSKAKSNWMKEYWKKRREEKLNQRGLPTIIETHHKPVEPTPVVERKPSHEEGRLAFLPVGRVRKNRAWTKEEDEVLPVLWKKYPPGEVAKRLLRTVKNVEKRYVKLKEDAVIRKTLRMPKSERGAKFMDSYRKSWDAGLTKTKQRWRPRDDAKLVELAKRGWTSKQISQELKRSVGSILVRYRLATGNNVLPADRKRKKKSWG
jgi:hypothetical protein